MQTYILQELCDHLGLSSIGTDDAEISQGHRRALKMACTTTLVKVSSGPIRTCLQCPLCFNLVHEATTISECLHTFCKSCIHQELDDGENDCCPICNVNLGCSPLEKLRADHQLADVCAKIFPVTVKETKKLNIDIDGEATEPVRRKERSLSSLGIGTAPLSHPGFVSRRTKSVSRRSTARDATSDEEAEENKADKGNLKRGRQEESSSDAVTEESDEADGFVKNQILSDGEQDDRLGREQLSPKRKLARSSRQQHSKNGDPSKAGFNERSKISETLNSTATRLMNKEIKPPRMREKFDKYLISESPLAQLAEVAVEQAGHKDSFDPPKGRRAPRGRGKREENTTHFVIGGSLSWKMMLETIRDEPPPQEKRQKSSILAPMEVAPSALIKPPLIRSLSSAIRKPPNPAIISRQYKKNMGFWFSLEAAHNQLGETSLPQISTRFLRIKNGKLPVSSVKKYLVKKLDLQSEADVEITCRGQPVVPNLPLEKVQGIWLATNPPSSALLPALKELNSASHDDRSWVRFKGRSAEHCMMVLTYARHPRLVTGP